jgi:hypothetical protein
VQVALVLAQVLPEPERFYNQVPKVLGDLGLHPFLFEDLPDPFPSDELDVRDTVAVTKDHPDPAGGDALLAQVQDDLLDRRDIGVGPGRGLLAEGSNGSRVPSASCMHSCHCGIHLRLRNVNPKRVTLTLRNPRGRGRTPSGPCVAARRTYICQHYPGVLQSIWAGEY